MSAPFCPGCGCVILREGQHCQSCRIKHGLEYDECTCYSDCPEDCKSKLEHDCCCMNALDIDECRAPDWKHDCVCSEEEDCRSLIHYCGPYKAVERASEVLCILSNEHLQAMNERQPDLSLYDHK